MEYIKYFAVYHSLFHFLLSAWRQGQVISFIMLVLLFQRGIKNKRGVFLVLMLPLKMDKLKVQPVLLVYISGSSHRWVFEFVNAGRFGIIKIEIKNSGQD